MIVNGHPVTVQLIGDAATCAEYMPSMKLLLERMARLCLPKDSINLGEAKLDGRIRYDAEGSILGQIGRITAAARLWLFNPVSEGGTHVYSGLSTDVVKPAEFKTAWRYAAGSGYVIDATDALYRLVRVSSGLVAVDYDYDAGALIINKMADKTDFGAADWNKFAAVAVDALTGCLVYANHFYVLDDPVYSGGGWKNNLRQFDYAGHMLDESTTPYPLAEFTPVDWQVRQGDRDTFYAAALEVDGGAVRGLLKVRRWRVGGESPELVYADVPAILPGDLQDGSQWSDISSRWFLRTLQPHDGKLYVLVGFPQLRAADVGQPVRAYDVTHHLFILDEKTGALLQEKRDCGIQQVAFSSAGSIHGGVVTHATAGPYSGGLLHYTLSTRLMTLKLDPSGLTVDKVLYSADQTGATAGSLPMVDVVNKLVQEYAG